MEKVIKKSVENMSANITNVNVLMETENAFYFEGKWLGDNVDYKVEKGSYQLYMSQPNEHDWYHINQLNLEKALLAEITDPDIHPEQRELYSFLLK